jgi:hypothetical protein
VVRQEIVERIMKVYLQDTAKAAELQGDGTYLSLATQVADGEALFSSQMWFINGRSIT